MTERKCPNCGALPARTASKFCEYCGTELPREEAAPAPAPTSPFGDLDARFAAIQNHAELDQYMAYEPPTRALGIHTGLSIASLFVFAIAGLGIAVVLFGICPPLGFLPLALVIFGGYALSKQLSRTSGSHSAPLERLPALVVDERTKVSGGQQSSAKTQYYATLQFPDGTRRELDAFGNVAGKITRGDMGIAYIKGEYLMAFGRLAV